MTSLKGETQLNSILQRLLQHTLDNSLIWFDGETYTKFDAFIDDYFVVQVDTWYDGTKDGKKSIEIKPISGSRHEYALFKANELTDENARLLNTLYDAIQSKLRKPDDILNDFLTTLVKVKDGN